MRSTTRKGGLPPPQEMPLEWGGFIIRPEDRKYPSPHGIPNSSGVYAWYSREGDLLYVGRSKQMNSRLRKHHMPNWGGRILSYREVPERYLAGVEMAHVKTLVPFHNAAEESADVPYWDAICAAIDKAWQDVLPAMQVRVKARESAIIAGMTFGRPAIAARL